MKKKINYFKKIYKKYISQVILINNLKVAIFQLTNNQK
jgi:hypothetical protein